MSLKLRRGTNAERITITPAEGEVIYTTDTKKLFAGDGVTPGGNVVSGINGLIEDPSPQLGTDLDLNTNDITGTGNITISGQITGTAILADTVESVEVLTAQGGIVGDLTGSVFGDDSILLVDGVNSTLNLSTNTLNEISDVGVDYAAVQNNQALMWNSALSKWVAGDVNMGETFTGTVIGNVQGDLTGTVIGNVIGSLSGNVIGSLDGDMIGSVLGEDSTVLVNSITNSINLNNNSINDLADVIAIAPSDDDIIYFNQANNLWQNAQLPSLLNGTTLQVSIDGDLKGSVFADDSTVIVDSINQTISVGGMRLENLQIYSDYFGEPIIMSQRGGGDPLIIENGPGLGLSLHGYDGTYANKTDYAGGDYLTQIKFKALSAGNYLPAGGVIVQWDPAVTLSADQPASIISFYGGDDSTGYSFLSWYSRTSMAQTKIFRPEPVADVTTRNTNITAPQEGMIIYVTDGDGAGNGKFQGYTNNGWVDLN